MTDPALADLPPMLGRLLEEACDRFEAAWRGGLRPTLEEALAGADRDLSPLLLRELVLLDAFYRRQAGEQPRPEDYRTHFASEDTDWLTAALAGAAAETSVNEPSPELRAGRRPTAAAPWPTLAGYDILGELGRGGMGIVYKARHLALARVVALKLMRWGADSSPEDHARFRSEGQAVARLQHANVVQIYEVGEQDGRPFFAMEFLEGGSLGRQLSGIPRPAREAAVLVETLARAVHAAHRAHIVHRDLKPENVLLAADGTPKIVDFGLAKQDQLDLTCTGAIVGTPSYMAPEQAAGDNRVVGPAADVYALGAILYECLTGRPPFRGATVLDTLEQVRAQEPVPPSRLQPTVPRDLEVLCLKCLEKEVPRRYASAAALADDLGRFLRGEPIAARPAGKAERLARWVKRHPARATLLSLSLLVVVLGVGSFLGYQQVRIGQAQQEARREYLRREATTSLEEARGVLRGLHETLGDPLKVHTLLSDPETWSVPLQAARAAWERARKLADTEPDLLDDDLTAQLRQLKGQVDADEQDYRLAKTLDDYRLEEATKVVGKYDRSTLARKYASVFAAAGLDPYGGDPVRVADRMRRYPLRYVLVAALDHWAQLKLEEPHLSRLLEVARRADPDPWRDRFRQSAVWKDRKSLERLAREVKVGSQSLDILVNLGVRLRATGGDPRPFMKAALVLYPNDFSLNLYMAWFTAQPADTTGYLRAALAVRPRSAGLHYLLAHSLWEQKELEAAIGHYRRAVELGPTYAAAHNNLALLLHYKKDFDGAIHHYRQSIQSDPAYPLPYNNLGRVLYDLRDWQGAIAHHREALRLDPGYVSAHYNLGRALVAVADLEGAIGHYREGLKWDPDDARLHCNLGAALQKQGKFAQALAELRRGDQLGSQQPDWKHPSKQWVARCQRLLQLDQRLTAILADQAPLPAKATEQLELFDMCRRYKKHHAAARLYARTLAGSQLVAAAFVSRRYVAAASAALAAAGQGEDAPSGLEEKGKLRQQALVWLRAELTRLGGLLPSGPETSTPAAIEVLQRLSLWQTDTELASVRAAQELAQLPREEQPAWERFWTDVAALRKRTDSLFRLTTIAGVVSDGQREQQHRLPLVANRTYVLDLQSRQFDAFLRLEDDSGKQLAVDDDGGGGRNARIVYTPARTGIYRVIATSYGRWGRGAYALQVREFIGAGEGN